MSDQVERLSDDAIEESLARRAPHGPDGALLESIMFAAAATPQLRSRRPVSSLPARVPVHLAWIAVVMALLLAVATLIVGGGGPRPPEMAVTVDPSASPSLRASPLPSSVSDPGPDPCAGGTIDVLPGVALPPLTDPLVGLDVGRGVYAGDTGDLWAVVSGQGSASRIAKFTSEPSVLEVLELSPDGSRALVRAGHIALDARVTPGCADLFIVATDGSSATRLTTLEAGWVIAGAGFAPDGVRVAYSAWGPGTPTITDLATELTTELPCEGRPVIDPLRVSWSPGGDRVVTHCDADLAIIDSRGAVTPIHIPPNGDSLPFTWTDDTHLLIVRVPSGGPRGRMSIESFDVVAQTSTVIGRIDPLGDLVDSPLSGGAFSPDGRWLAFLGWDRTLEAAVGYLVPATGGAATRILRPNQVILPQNWSADSRALVYIDMIGSPTMHLGQLEVDTLQQSFIGTLPGGRYLKGVWQIP